MILISTHLFQFVKIAMSSMKMIVHHILWLLLKILQFQKNARTELNSAYHKDWHWKKPV